MLRRASGNDNPVLSVEMTYSVIENSRLLGHVKIDRDRLKQFASRFMESDRRHWLSACKIDLSGMSADERLAFLFVFNSISFSYWGSPKWSVPLDEGMPQRGILCMIDCLRRAVADGRPILNPKYLATIKREELAEILRGTAEIPLLRERCEILQELGRVTATWGGKFSNYLVAARGDAVDLLLGIAHISSFQDESVYRGYIRGAASLFPFTSAPSSLSGTFIMYSGEKNMGICSASKS